MIMVVPVTFRRKAPTAAFWIAVAGGGLQALTKGGPSPADVAIVVLLYTLAAYRPRSQSVPGLLVAIAGSMVALEYWMADSWAQARHMLLTGLVVYGGTALLAWVLGDSMRYRRAYYVALEDRAARLERERDIQAQIGAAAERARIARELHDVVAHSMSVIAVQAGVANYVAGTRPEEAARALSSIEETSRGALHEMRALLGVLRDEGTSGAGLVPAPGLADLKTLADRTAEAGVRVDLDIHGARPALPAGLDLAAYRVIQEAITNVIKHAATDRCRVAVGYEDQSLNLEITDNGIGAGRSTPGPGTGHGITGMRERAGMYGGEFSAAPRPGGGFRVSARFPLTGTAA
jgi:signal transduction histidine kinase